MFCLSQEEKLSANTMADIMASGYSRVLVYAGSDTLNIRGYLQVCTIKTTNLTFSQDVIDRCGGLKRIIAIFVAAKRV